MNRWFSIFVFLSVASMPMGKAHCDEMPVVVAEEMTFSFKTGLQEEIVIIRQNGTANHIEYYCNGIIVVDNALTDKLSGAVPGYVVGLHLNTRGGDCSRGASLGVYLMKEPDLGAPETEHWVFMFSDNRLTYSGRGL